MKDVKGFEGKYAVTEDGRVYSYPKGNNANRNGKWLVAHPDGQGYPSVTFTINYARKSFKVHRLVAGAFLDGSGEQINHIDGDKHNNHYSNLEWCTNQENTIHAYRIGLKTVPHTKEKILKLLSRGHSQGQVAKKLGIHQSTVSRVFNGKTRRYAQ